MEKLVKGDVVVVPFPFSDLSSSKKRPSLVISVLKGDDLILCQITSKTVTDTYAIQLNEKEFKSGTLKQESNIRPNKLFIADEAIIQYRVGTLRETKNKQVIQKICEIIKK